MGNVRPAGSGRIARNVLPQIWMTYEELAAMLECSPAEARERIHLDGLDRKISRDGRKRAKLDAELVALFIARIRSLDASLDRGIEDLKQVHRLLREPDQRHPHASAPSRRQAG